MSTATAKAAAMPDSVAERLREKGIHRVIVVDDTFDPPARSDFEHNELADFWAELDLESMEQREVLTRILRSIPESEDEIDDAGVAALYEHRDTLGPLQLVFNTHLRAPLEEKHAALERFTDYLRDELGLEVHTCGTENVASPGPVNIIFLDYYLGTPRDEGSVGRARDAIRQLLKAYRVGDEKPLVVLMSSYQDVKGLAEDFRGQTGIIGGMFYFVPKPDLTDRVKLFLNLDMLAAALPSGHRIQQFMDTVEAKADLIKSEFLAGIKRLNLDDYIYIQRLSLQADGHPLGDYLLWLYSAYFGHLLFEHALGGERRNLDKITFTDWMPSHSTPSRQLTAMYHAALFDTTVGPLSEHPRGASGIAQRVVADTPAGTAPSAVLNVSSEAPHELPQAEVSTGVRAEGGRALLDHHPSDMVSAGGGDLPLNKDATANASELPYFNLGDVFLNATSTQLFMVINPACDLEFAPDDKRLPDPDESIVFIPGVLEKLGTTPANNGLRTELFEHKDESYRVRWQPKRVQAVAHKHSVSWLQSRGLTRVARLRMPFSLEIQQHFASGLTRVGVPVPPPFYRPLRVALYERTADDGYRAVPFTDPYAEAFVIQTIRDGEKCSLTTGLVRDLQRRIDELARVDSLPVDDEALSGDEEKRRQRPNKRASRAKTASENYSAWREVSTPFPLPKPGKLKEFDQAGIVVGRDVSVNGKWTYNALLMVHISDPTPTKAEDAVGETTPTTDDDSAAPTVMEPNGAQQSTDDKSAQGSEQGDPK